MSEILIILVAAVSSVLVLSRLGLGPFLGYLVSGALIGPAAFGLIQDPDAIRHIGEFGVVFLLFLIGIEIKPKRLWVMRRLVFGLGAAQTLVTAILVFAGFRFVLGWDTAASLVAGGGLALSSTAIGLQYLADSNNTATQWGRAGIAILLLQDLAVVPFLALVPIVGEGVFDVSESMGLAVLESVLVIAAVILVGRLALTPLLDLAARARSREVFAATALLLVLGAAFLMESAGLSAAMGAFLAGMLLSNNEFRHQVEADVEPFRGLLLGLFFIGVGMAVDIGNLADSWALVLFGTLGLLALKAAVIYPLARVSGLPRDGAIRLSLLLAQAGEFGFVLFSVAVLQGVLQPEQSEPLIAIVVLSMVATPMLNALARRLVQRGAPVATAAPVAPTPEADPGLVIIAGYGRVGETVGHMLTCMGVSWVAIDKDVERVQAGRHAGGRVIYGDASHAHVLTRVGLAKARLLLVTLDDARMVERNVMTVRQHRSDLPIVVRARDLKAAAFYQSLGVQDVLPETLESSLQLGAIVFDRLGTDEAMVSDLLDDLRAENYKSLKMALSAAPAAAEQQP